MHLIFRAYVHVKSHNTGLVAFVHLTYCVDNTCRIYTYIIVIKQCGHTSNLYLLRLID
jgi:hypothetical protein